MEPAMALCAGVAALTLTLGVLGSLPAAGRRAAAMRIPIPIRPLAGALMLASLMAVLARPRPVAATVAPPIVRLADETESPSEEDASPADEPAAIPTPSSDQTSSRAAATTGRAASNAVVHVVERGDCLWRIAASVLLDRYGHEPLSGDIARFWPVIYAANRAVIGDDPNLIFPGQRLSIPEG